MSVNINDLELHSDTIVWRYLSFNRFKQLIHEKQLYFSRIDQFSDFNEGLMTEKEVSDCKTEFYEQGAEDLAQVLVSFNRHMQHKYLYANCWTKCDYEQNLLWRSYGTPDENDEEKFKIAIKTTVGKLVESLNIPKNINLLFRSVTYIDFENEVTTNDFNDKVFFKRKEYESEREIRLVFRHSSHDEQVIESLDSGRQVNIDGKKFTFGAIKPLKDYPDTPKGILIDLNPAQLIDELYIEAVPMDWGRLLDDKKYKSELETIYKYRFDRVKSILTESSSKMSCDIIHPSNIL